MAFSEKTKQMMADSTFRAKLEAAEDMEALKAVFATEGIDYDAEFIPDDDESADENVDVELSPEDLDNVSGGRMSAAQITKLVINAARKGYKVVNGGVLEAVKFGGSIGILSVAYFDATVHNDVFYTFNQSTIEAAMKYVDCT